MNNKKYTKENLEKYYDIDYCIESFYKYIEDASIDSDSYKNNEICKWKIDFSDKKNIDMIFKNMTCQNIIKYLMRVWFSDILNGGESSWKYFEEKFIKSIEVEIKEEMFDNYPGEDVKILKHILIGMEDQLSYRFWKNIIEFIVANNDGNCLQIVPEKYLDKKMCLTAVNQNGDNIKDVPVEFVDKEMIKKAVKSCFEEETIEYICKEYCNLLDEEICMTIIMDTVILETLLYIPKSLMSQKICEKAVKRYYKNILYVPGEFKNYEMVCNLLENIKKGIRYVNFDVFEGVKNEIIEKLFLERRDLIDYIEIKYIKNDNLKTYEMCLRSIINNWENIKYVPRKFWDDKILEIVVKESPEFVLKIKNNISYKICQIAIDKDIKLLGYLERFLTAENLQEIVGNNPEAIEYVDIHKYPELWRYHVLRHH